MKAPKFQMVLTHVSLLFLCSSMLHGYCVCANVCIQVHVYIFSCCYWEIDCLALKPENIFAFEYVLLFWISALTSIFMRWYLLWVILEYIKLSMLKKNTSAKYIIYFFILYWFLHVKLVKLVAAVIEK